MDYPERKLLFVQPELYSLGYSPLTSVGGEGEPEL